MDYKFDRKIVLAKDENNRNRHQTCLKEFDNNNKELGEYIPWVWRTNFLATLSKQNLSISGQYEKLILKTSFTDDKIEMEMEREIGHWS